MYHELNMSYKFNGDQNMKNIENKITEFANTFNYLNDMAYTHYKPSVDMYISQLKNGENVCENELCLFLDYMLDFCGDDRMLKLYKELLRAMLPKFPKAVNDYIKFYKEEYDDTSKDEIQTQKQLLINYEE